MQLMSQYPFASWKWGHQSHADTSLPSTHQKCLQCHQFGQFWETKLVKSVFWSHLGQLIVILPIFFSYHAVHILERHNPGLSNQNPWNIWYWAEGALMSCNRTEEDEGEWDRTGVSALEDLTKTRTLVADATQWLPWEENQIPGHSVFK